MSQIIPTIIQLSHIPTKIKKLSPKWKYGQTNNIKHQKQILKSENKILATLKFMKEEGRGNQNGDRKTRQHPVTTPSLPH